LGIQRFLLQSHRLVLDSFLYQREYYLTYLIEADNMWSVLSARELHYMVTDSKELDYYTAKDYTLADCLD
jgi:hypothetical protein